jgi:signal transduction histidine kinase
MPDGQDFSLVLLYFFYGLAFIFLGLSIAVKDMSESRLQLADSLPSLAVFGFSHGLHEWLECYVLLVGRDAVAIPLHYLKYLTMVISFLFLNHFGILLLRSQPRIRWQWLRVLIPFLLLFLGMYLWLSQAHLDLQALRRADLPARLTIGFLGAGLASFALYRHSRLMQPLNRAVAMNLCRAASCFALYAVAAGIVPSHFVFPMLGIRVEVLRSAAAVGIAYFMVKALNIFNIETRKKLEQQFRKLTQTEKLTALGKMAAGIAHEINNPLTNVSLNIELLKQELQGALFTASIEKRFSTIERNLARAANIAGELLGFSGQREANMREVDLNTLVDGTLTLLGSRRRDFSIKTELLPLPPVMADPGKVEEVLLNVLINAMEASSPGGNIELRSRRQGAEVLVEIIDHGSGIAPEDLPRVMEPFYTTKEVGKGTGLGLSICYSIMEMHGGKIELADTAGGGTTVSLAFPIAEGEQHDGNHGGG